MQNCELTIAGNEWKLSPTTERGLCDEVRLSGSLAEAIKNIELRGWKAECGTVCFKREGVPEHIAELGAAASEHRGD
jgi:hypothetical protein